MYLESAVNPEVIILISALITCVPVVILAIIVFIKLIVKVSKPVPGAKKGTLNEEWQKFFGGSDNIEKVETELSRVHVTVKDLSKVDMASLQANKISALIVGNTIKCSSKSLVDKVNNK